MPDEEPVHLSVEILKQIRDETRATNERLDEAIERIQGVERSVVGVERSVVHSEVRTATAIADLAGNVAEMTELMRENRSLRPRVERCERDIDDLKRVVQSREG